MEYFITEEVYKLIGLIYAALPTQGVVTTGPNKDALIGAMALVKATPSSDAEVTWSHFVLFYNKLLTWDPTTPF